MRERQIHVAVVDFLRLALPSDAVLHHSPNEGRRGWTGQRDLKTHGVTTGWPDLEIFWRKKSYFIELKAPKKYPTAEQKECHRRLRDAGFAVLVCRSIADVEMFLQGEGMPLNARIAA